MTKRHPGSGLWVSIGKGRKWEWWIDTQQWKKEPSVCEGLRGSVVGQRQVPDLPFQCFPKKDYISRKWQQLQLKCLYFLPLSANKLFTGWGQLFLGIKPIQLNPQKCTILIPKKRANFVLGKEMMDHEEESSLGSLYFYLDLCHIVCVWMLTLRVLLGHYLKKDLGGEAHCLMPPLFCWHIASALPLESTLLTFAHSHRSLSHLWP